MLQTGPGAMEPLSAINAIGLAANVLQLLDISLKIVSKAKTIRQDGRLPEHRDIQTVTTDLQGVNLKLVDCLDNSSETYDLHGDDEALRKLCLCSSQEADKLVQLLLRIQKGGNSSRYKSFRQALKTVYKKEDLNQLRSNLQEYRTQLNTRLLVSLRERLDGLRLDVPQRFDGLDRNVRCVADGLEQLRLLHVDSQERQSQDVTRIIADYSETIREQLRAMTILIARPLTPNGNGIGKEDVTPKDLFDAVREHNYGCLKMLAGTDPASMTHIGQGGQTILHYSTRRGDVEMVRFLLAEVFIKDIDKRARDSLGMTAKDYCVDGSLLWWLLVYGPDIEGRDNDESTASGFFAGQGDLKAVQYLLACGANAGDAGRMERSPLMEAADAGQQAVVEELLHHNLDVNYVNKLGDSAILLAARHGYVRSVELLLKHGASVDGFETTKTGNAGATGTTLCKSTPLSESCTGGHVELVQLLLSYGAQPNIATSSGGAPIQIAAKKGYSVILRHLLDAGANANIRNARTHWTALHEACEHSNVSVVETLLTYGCETNTHTLGDGSTPLTLAAMKRNHAIVMRLLACGRVDINATDSRNKTALYHAAYRNAPDVVAALLNRGAKTDTMGQEGGNRYNALLQACQSQRCYSIVERLLQAGANLEACNTQGWTALHESSAHGNYAVTRLLLEYGANANATDYEDSQTPLHKAAYRGHSSVLKLLLEQGHVIVDAKDQDQKTALSWACHHGHVETARLLLAHGADANSRESDNWYTPLNRAVCISMNQRWLFLKRHLIRSSVGLRKPSWRGAPFT